MILVIGHLRLTGGEGLATFRQQGYRFADFAELDGPLLEATRPDMVISPLIGERFDAMDVARRLQELGYQGPYRALSAPLPRPSLVRSEVRSAAPELDFDLLIVSQDPTEPG